MGEQVFVTSLGDSRAYVIRAGNAKQLTTDHTVAQHLVETGALSPEDAVESPYNNVLYKLLGCAAGNENPEVKIITPQAGDCFLLATDGLTVAAEDLASGPAGFADVQQWAEHLVKTALLQGSRDNVTCIAVAFE